MTNGAAREEEMMLWAYIKRFFYGMWGQNHTKFLDGEEAYKNIEATLKEQP